MAGWGSELLLTIGNNSAADSKIIFDGTAKDFYLGQEDASDDLFCGLGTTVATTPAWSFDENLLMTIYQKATFSLGLVTAVRTVTANTSAQAASLITAGVVNVDCTGVTGAATDFIVLPALSAVPVGHTITILCNASSAFELRTPASSSEEINSENCDGTKEYLCTDTEVVKVIKVNNTIGWMAHAFSQIGAVVTAVVPD